jgi:hypothetical protein
VKVKLKKTRREQGSPLTSSTKSVPITPLTPSELILLNGVQFARAVYGTYFGNVEIPHSHLGDPHYKSIQVSATQLVLTMLSAAFLANEQIGAIRLEIRQRKVFFGLGTVNELFAVPGDNVVVWSDRSIESEVRPLAERLLADGKRNRVSTIVYVWLTKDSNNPWQFAAGLVKEELAARGYLNKVSKTKLKIFTSTYYVLAKSTTSIIAHQPLQSVWQLLAACQRTRSEIWELLVKEIRQGMRERLVLPAQLY